VEDRRRLVCRPAADPRVGVAAPLNLGLVTGPPSARRVAVALHEPVLGGATTAFLHALPQLERRGWSFTFWTPGRGAAEAELKGLGYPVAAAERQLRFSLASLREPPGAARRLSSVPGYLRRWRAWLAAQDAALLHSNSILTLPEAVSRPRSGSPVVLYAHEILPAGPRGALTARLARRVDAVAAVSDAAATALRRWGVETTLVYPGTPTPRAIRAPRRNGRLVIGTLGTICRRKGSDLFLAAAESVRSEREDIEFRMAGSVVPGGEQEWARGVVDVALRRGVQHKPWVDSFAELAEWDIFVLASRRDPFPLAVLEAMAMGLAVVGTRVDGVPEQLGEDAGLLVEPGDADAIAAAVLRLADSPDLRASLGAAARRRVERKFTLEQQVAGLERFYYAALGEENGSRKRAGWLA
jgi:glycosyltransferase involved in cell wall biosynthesis